jgi:chromate transporter
MTSETPTGPSARALREVAAVFLRLGIIGFGGPAAHVALMRDEVVRRRRWVSEPEFLDLLGATYLIPGPNSTEMAIHLGFVRARWPGLIVGGALFILPAALITLALAWLYVRYGSTPQAHWLLYGLKPAIVAVVAQALWGLSRTAIKGPLLAGIGLAVVLLYLAGVHEIALLFGGGAVALLVGRLSARRAAGAAGALALVGAAPALAQAAVAAPFAATTLFLTFLKIGAVLYGSGYVLLAFLRNDFVNRLGWLTDAGLLDAIAIGQFTPGPVLTTATFVGYVTGGVWGAVLATAGIFLPAFVFVALTNPVIPRLRRSPWTAPILDGVNVAALGLLAAVTWDLGRAALVDWFTVALALVAVALLIRVRLNSAWVLLGAALLGVAYRLLAG